MADFDHDPLTGMFTDFRGEVSSFVKPPGTRAAQATVRHRARVRTTLTSAAVVLAIAVPVAGYAAFGLRGSNGPPDVPASSAGVSASPSDSPSAELSTAPSATPGSGGPGLGIAPATRYPAGDALLSIPAWPSGAAVHGCPSGSVKFVNWQSGELAITDQVDVLGGTTFTAILLTCTAGGQSTSQVVVFEPHNGAFALLGRFVAQSGPVQGVYAIRVNAADPTGLDVQVRGSNGATSWQTYTVTTDGTLRRVLPPGTDPTKTGDLSVTATDLTFKAPTGQAGVDNPPIGTMVITVKNKGPAALPFTVSFPAAVGSGVPTGSSCDYSYGEVCTEPALGAGRTRTITLTFKAYVTLSDQDTVTTLTVTPTTGYDDANPNNNSTQFTYRYHLSSSFDPPK